MPQSRLTLLLLRLLALLRLLLQRLSRRRKNRRSNSVSPSKKTSLRAGFFSPAQRDKVISTLSRLSTFSVDNHVD
jgi:hypothetical protein